MEGEDKPRVRVTANGPDAPTDPSMIPAQWCILEHVYLVCKMWSSGDVWYE